MPKTYLSIFLGFFWICFTPIAKAQFSNYDSIAPKPSFNVSNYPWLHTEINMIQFYSADAISNFYNKWKKSDKEKISIIHFGDSHCQHEVLPATIRKNLQTIHGSSGRGLIFPYSAAKTYSSSDYKTSHTGVWYSERGYTMLPKLPMGVRGMTCKTISAPASLNFYFTNEVPEDETILKIFCKNSAASFDLNIEVNGKLIPVTIDDNNLPFIEVQIPSIKDKSLSIHVVKNNPQETEFELYGISLESSNKNGVLYHNAGVGAARWNSLLYLELLWDQLPQLNPDLIILDYGTNDYLYDDKIRPALESEIKKVIYGMKKVVPNANIILTSSQDLFFKRRNCRSGEPFSDMMHRIAAETKCCIFDWYWISGAQGTMHNWVQSGLAQADYIHLTNPGYELKGKLFYEAIKNSMEWLDKNTDASEFYFKIDSLKAQNKVIIDKLIITPAPVVVNNKTKVNPYAVSAASTAGRVKYIHKINNGESLYTIGKKYNVTINQLKSWNNMTGDKIIAGKTLIVYIKK